MKWTSIHCFTNPPSTNHRRIYQQQPVVDTLSLWIFFLFYLWFTTAVYGYTYNNTSSFLNQKNGNEENPTNNTNNKTHWEWNRNHYFPSMPTKTTTTTTVSDNTKSILHRPQQQQSFLTNTEALLVSDAPTSTMSIFQQQQSQTIPQPQFRKKSILIIQDAGMGIAEREISDITSRISRAYAKRWYVVVYIKERKREEC